MTENSHCSCNSRFEIDKICRSITVQSAVLYPNWDIQDIPAVKATESIDQLIIKWILRYGIIQRKMQ